ncbi:hypothetical protein BDF21DRAFT_395962 [Thamnidium elegans]|nr:hypothetical protein BDF21DRAFT_395962 [Thamnidium elegans]
MSYFPNVEEIEVHCPLHIDYLRILLNPGLKTIKKFRMNLELPTDIPSMIYNGILPHINAMPLHVHFINSYLFQTRCTCGRQRTSNVTKDEADEFLYEQGLRIARYIIPKLPKKLFQPILQQEPYSYKAFLVGVLYHMYSKNYGFGFNECLFPIHLKNKLSDLRSALMGKAIIPLFKKECFKFKKTDAVRSGRTVHEDDALEKLDGPGISRSSFELGFDAGFVVSVVYNGYSSSLSFAAKYIGEEENVNDTVIAEPMTLARF